MGFEIVSECMTKETGGDGVRHSCQAEDWSSVTAPPNHVINQNSLKTEWLSQNGSQNGYHTEWADWVEVIPGTGIVQPMTYRIKAFATGPKGHWSGRGWSKVKVTGEFAKYK